MLVVSRFDSERDNQPKAESLSWEQLATLLNDFGNATCTLAPGPNQCGTGPYNYDGKGSCKSKFGPAWSPASYVPGATRSKHNVQSVCLLVLDCDHLSDTALDSLISRLSAYRYLLHSTHSDGRNATPENANRCVRLILPLSRPVPGSEWFAFWRRAIQHLQVGDWVDTTPKDPSRLYFLPCSPADGDPIFDTNEGQTLDVDSVGAVQLSTVESPSSPTPLATQQGTLLGPIAADELAAALADIKERKGAKSGVPESRDTKTYAMAARLVKDWGLSEDQAWPLLVDWNKTCEPPAPESVLRTKLSNAIAYGSEAPGSALREYRARRDSREVINLYAAGITEETLENPRATPTFKVELVKAKHEFATVLNTLEADAVIPQLFQSTTNSLNTHAAETPWLVDYLFAVGGVSGIIGEPKSTKSWMALDIAISVALGSKALNHFTVPKPRRVAYFFAEDLQSAINSRIRAFAEGRSIPTQAFSDNLFIQPRGTNIDISKDLDCAQIIASCRMIGGDLGLLILDPFRDIHTGSENDSDSMSQVMKRLRALSTILNCTVLIVHHSKKVDPAYAGSDGSEIRGSSTINAALDSRLILQDLDGDRETSFESTLKVIVKSKRGAGTPRVLLTIEDDPKTSQAVRAAWQVKPKKPEKTKVVEREAESFAYDLVRVLFENKRKGNPAPGLTALRFAAKQNGTEIRVAKEYAIDRGWIVFEMGQYRLTPLGEKHAKLSLRRDNENGDPE